MPVCDRIPDVVVTPRYVDTQLIDDQTTFNGVPDHYATNSSGQRMRYSEIMAALPVVRQHNEAEAMNARTSGINNDDNLTSNKRMVACARRCISRKSGGAATADPCWDTSPHVPCTQTMSDSGGAATAGLMDLKTIGDTRESGGAATAGSDVTLSLIHI